MAQLEEWTMATHRDLIIMTPVAAVILVHTTTKMDIWDRDTVLLPTAGLMTVITLTTNLPVTISESRHSSGITPNIIQRGATIPDITKMSAAVPRRFRATNRSEKTDIIPMIRIATMSGRVVKMAHPGYAKIFTKIDIYNNNFKILNKNFEIIFWN